ncbi:hypothetical protein COW36_19835 [bacterium (Candidatus Blackallbacteria) CG17_big_fil_post_rev_8_21_14_2_50_48_46]|uniref:Periplasmic heavy metal sensor n=1 Tax=bacterium (Candidatus Blackallbacteria) CG17_big_fil_post_rev_8_21_14_2_50_48_46 TaxID=2014261 RepID=A0A2M7FZR2_9BACT|nr:MAG: hypothetical protein COW64_15460 [bacterium (Candidatus Blackallbacteria) CG18_big_fil_WC_8_21_14_2_50_49_26]PIW14901.1 MAG: hypothetical protein COW36_19835 [bacterium (Candidatus Blackallbacteria) CG17_big_fil_post_rev_8_21_14_2_50_48_46]PIW44311.1 MAG: hypothetical protein COW20_24525 [bacterium (Candidatus Blackallbacteria) CG13_big_fil_rev_8_21_14_2_50_49_14]
MKIVKQLSVLLTSALLLAACASPQPGQNPAPSEDAFSLMGLDAPVYAQGMPGEGRRGQGSHFGPGRHLDRMKALIKDLNLTDAQIAELKAMRQAARSEFQNHRQDRDAFKAVFKQAFLNDRFDANALKAKLQPMIQARKEAMTQRMAEKLVSFHKILTPEQRKQFFEKLDKLEAGFDTFSKMPFADKMAKGPGNRFEILASELGLSEDQKLQLTQFFENTQPQRQGQFQEFKSVKAELVKLFQAGNPSVASVKAILDRAATQMNTHLEQRLSMMEKFHAVLTPSQRQNLVKHFEERAAQYRNHDRGQMQRPRRLQR